jgi:hypothetical protein
MREVLVIVGPVGAECTGRLWGSSLGQVYNGGTGTDRENKHPIYSNENHVDRQARNSPPHSPHRRIHTHMWNTRLNPHANTHLKDMLISTFKL